MSQSENFLVYSRSAPWTRDAADDPELNERHWSYMDEFNAGMTARGPTLGADRQTWTGSLHIVELPGPEAVRQFVAREPYNQAGLFEEHFIWSFANLLGQTMWQFTGGADEPRFLVLVLAVGDLPKDLRPAPADELPPQLRDRLIVYGELRRVDDQAPAGMALAAQVPTRETLDALLRDERLGLTDRDRVWIHDWEFGGRR